MTTTKYSKFKEKIEMGLDLSVRRLHAEKRAKGQKIITIIDGNLAEVEPCL
jgi:hypothetical protein